MRAFVTGATGFVGGHVAEALLRRGDALTVLARSPARAAGLAARGATVVAGDLASADALARAAEGADVIYHVAALTGAPDEAAFLRANRDGTAAVLDAARRTAPGARVVLVSSMAAGGPAVRGRPHAGELPAAPVTAYGRSKLAAEEVVRGGELPWTIVRPPTVYGPRDRDNLLALFRLARLGVVPVFGDGTMELSAVHVEDLAEAIVRAGTAADVVRRAFYVNHPEVVTSAALVEQVAAALGRRVTLLPLPRGVARAALGLVGGAATLLGRATILHPDKIHEFYAEAWTADPSPFMAATGWAPRHDLATGLAQTLRWYREAGWL